MKRAICLLLTALMGAGILAGCQRTPESQIVVGKDNEKLIEQATKETGKAEPADCLLAERLGITGRFVYENSYLDGKLIIRADAPIVIPDTAQLPVVRVEPADFSQDLIDKLYAELIGETPMFENPQLWSKEQIEQEIIALRDEIEASPEKRDVFAQEIRALEARYESASDTPARIPANAELGTYTQYNVLTGEVMGTLFGLDITSNPGMSERTRSTAITLQVINNSTSDDITVSKHADGSGATVTDHASRGARLYYHNPDLSIAGNTVLAPVDEASFTEHQAALTGMRPNDAADMVADFMRKIGVTNMRPESVEIGYILSEEDFAKREELNANERAAMLGQLAAGTYAIRPLGAQFVISCNRLVSGIPVMNGSLSSYVGDAMYGKQWFYESCEITVTTQGICDIRWVSPHQVVETVTNNSNLLPFAAVQDIFERMFRVVYEADSDAKREFEVQEARLALRRVMEQNSVEKGLLIPVWDFYGQATYQYGDQPMIVPATVYGEKRPILTINAVDGSIIDLGKGY